MKLQNLKTEQLQEIVDGAPDKTADYFIADKNAREYHSLEFGSYFSSELGEWEDSDFRTESELKNIYRNVLKLSDIRAELAMRKIVPNAQSDFVVGDLVVVINPRATKNIFEVEALTHEGVFANECTAVFIMRHFFTFDLIRLATPAEKAAGRRIDALTVCTEAEPLDLFNSKHCSPRNYNNDSALRVSEIKASAAYSKMALTNFTLSEKNGRLKTNNHALKAALAMAIVVGVVGWML